MFWNRLYALCKEKNTTPTSLAKELKLSTSKVTAWKNGAIPKGDILLLLSNYFNVSVDYLLGSTEQRKKPAALSDNELDSELISRLQNLSPAQVQRVKDFVEGLRSTPKD